MTRDTFVTDHLPPADQLPEFRFTLPELQYAERLNSAAELLRDKDRDAVAVVNGMGRWTYGEIDDFSGRIARFLVEKEGLVPGERVLLRGPNCYTLFACWLGVLKAGGVVVATMPMLRPGEIATVIDKARISHALVDSRFIGDFREGAEQTRQMRSVTVYDGDHGKGPLNAKTEPLEPLDALDTASDDPALIAFTSGTTGIPKGCVHFHRDVLAPCDSFARHVVGGGKGDVFLTSAPLAFTFGLGATLLFPFRAGATAATIERPDKLMDAVIDHGVTHLATAPTAYKALLSHPRLDEALKSLRVCISAGEHLPEATWHAWHERTGIKLIDGIGSTELMHIFISASGEDIRPGSTGKAVPGYEATILDPDNRPLDEGEGRLAIKGPTGCRYLDDPRQSDYVVDGWNVTGDTYAKDADGYFWYRARSDDMIISAGYNIGAPEVENALLAHDAVAECAVIGVPCEERGQKIKAFIVLAKGWAAGQALIEELQTFTKGKIAPYKYPREIEFRDALPKTATGKLRRVALREE
ncbi:AMP-binding protein [Sphingomicrobium lutaoense]|uniref:2-aminobenzoate-CoA ligase n=1 Tax=Sphingomicrobium lutaoense TaxID=515949 RepID=A0A839Z043_9SPHN|nr:AMP-binding protein [Sphingomicrobium lutaoense]MBB3763062.1 2-aminobenzoate-CoA ligase [Sphingomicrobium lutaoense]